MVIDLGSGSLFKPQGLEQDSGRISERWGQDGSVIIQFSVSLASDSTAYTVTAGKRLYINALYMTGDSITGVYLRDGGGAGTIRSYSIFLANTTSSVNLSTPIFFDTDVAVDVTSGTNGYITATGWEEDAP